MLTPTALASEAQALRGSRFGGSLRHSTGSRPTGLPRRLKTRLGLRPWPKLQSPTYRRRHRDFTFFCHRRFAMATAPLAGFAGPMNGPASSTPAKPKALQLPRQPIGGCGSFCARRALYRRRQRPSIRALPPRFAPNTRLTSHLHLLSPILRFGRTRAIIPRVRNLHHRLGSADRTDPFDLSPRSGRRLQHRHSCPDSFSVQAAPAAAHLAFPFRGWPLDRPCGISSDRAVGVYGRAIWSWTRHGLTNCQALALIFS